MFNIFISGQDSSLSKYSYDTKVEGMAETPENYAAFQRDSNRMEKWAGRVFIKGKVLHQFMVGADWLESSSAQKDLGVVALS